MSEQHIKMLHDHINRQVEAQKNLTEVYSKNHKSMLDAYIKLGQEYDELKEARDCALAEIAQLKDLLKHPVKQAVHKLLRRGHYKKQVLIGK